MPRVRPAVGVQVLPVAAAAALLGAVGGVVGSGLLERVPPARLQRHGRLGAVGAVLRSGRYRAFLMVSLLLWTGFAAAWNFFALRIEEASGLAAAAAVVAAVALDHPAIRRPRPVELPEVPEAVPPPARRPGRRRARPGHRAGA